MTVTNYRFLSNLKVITFFWIQDAPVLLKECEDLKDAAPWSLMLADEQARKDLESVAARVFSMRGELAP